MQFNFQVGSDPNANSWITAAAADNYINVTEGYDANVLSFPLLGNWYGRWGSSASTGTISHEAGHLLGLPDDYDPATGISNPGHQGHMMGDSPGVVAQHEVNDILNGVGASCGCQH